MLNKQKGNMYEFITHTWNPIKGKCIHDCNYCYMKVWGNLKPIRLVEKELKDDLGKNNFIFVGSSTDMFAEDVSENWIRDVLVAIRLADKSNKYFFQTKNPYYFFKYEQWFPKKAMFCTTLESNRNYDIYGGVVNSIETRTYIMEDLSTEHGKDVAITIEPILDFDLAKFVSMIEDIKPKWVSIGADSKGHKLPEPSKEKVEALIKALKKFTKVKIKPNLKRITHNIRL